MVLGQLFCILAYPCTLWFCIVFFCDDHHFGENKWRRRFRGTSNGWGVCS